MKNQPLCNTADRFGLVTKCLHWTIATLILSEFVIVGIKSYVLVGEAYKSTGIFLIKELHKPIGVLVLGLGVFFLLWHTCSLHPRLPASIPRWQQWSARLAQSLLFVAMLLMPISGILMSAAAGRPVNFFHLGIISFGVTPNPDFAKRYFEIHEITSYLLLAVISIHVLAALKHHFWDKNEVLKRMMF